MYFMYVHNMYHREREKVRKRVCVCIPQEWWFGGARGEEPFCVPTDWSY